MSIFKGAGVAIVTPMKENGEVNYEKFAETAQMPLLYAVPQESLPH